MRLAIFKGEKSIDDLAARLFRVKAGDPQASRLATEALIKANPQLANLDRVPPGSVVVVPDTPHAVNAAEVVQPATTAAADFARSVTEHVTAFTTGLAVAAGNAAAQAEATLKLLRDRSVKAAAAQDPALRPRLAAIEENTKATRQDVEDKQAVLQEAIKQMQEDVAKFLASAPSAAPPPGPTPQPPPTGGPPSPRPQPGPAPGRPLAQPTEPAAPAAAPRKTAARRGRRKPK
jgi:phage tail protein X